MNEQGRNSQDQINKEKIARLPEREFRTMVVKIFQSLKNRMEQIQEANSTINTINKDIEYMKKEANRDE